MEKIIKALNELGYDVLFIQETNQIFVVNHFDVNIIEGKGDVGFSFIQGIEITSVTQSLNPNEPKIAMRARLETAIQEMPVLKMKYSSNHLWRLYVA